MPSKKKTQRTKDDAEEIIIKKPVPAYKYSAKGTSSLYEAIILSGQPCFVTWSQYHNAKKMKECIEEATRIIRPPNSEEYPYTPYDFTDERELNEYFARASGTVSLDELYRTVKKSFFQKYVDQDKNILTILSSDSMLTYFQDLFPIIHYSEGIGGNDVGKSSIGYTFEYTGYRVIRGTSISGANYFRILGPVEPGQCTIIEDEGDNISDDPDKVRILKSGYEYNAKIPKTNMNTRNQEQNWFYPYCYKMILAEKSLSEWKAKGLADRTFTFKCRPGRVRHSIKKVVSETINKSPELERLYNELLDFRKLMLCYRLVHYEDELPNIKISLINRDEELSYPRLQLFYGTEAFEEIKIALEFFINQRRERRQRSLEAALYPILKDLVSDDPNPVVEVLYSSIWTKITEGDTIKGNLLTLTQYETLEYGPIYQNTLSKFIGDKFSASIKHKEEGSVLSFDKQKFESYDDLYSHKVEGSENEVKIEVELVNDDPDGTEGMTAFSYAYDNFKDGSIDDKNNTNPSPEPSGRQSHQPGPIFPPRCYRCDFSSYETKEEYDYHCVVRHPGLPGYPGPADINRDNLVPQDMPWET
jgi:hypothetical protein